MLHTSFLLQHTSVHNTVKILLCLFNFILTLTLMRFHFNFNFCCLSIVRDITVGNCLLHNVVYTTGCDMFSMQFCYLFFAS